MNFFCTNNEQNLKTKKQREPERHDNYAKI